MNFYRLPKKPYPVFRDHRSRRGATHRATRRVGGHAAVHRGRRISPMPKPGGKSRSRRRNPDEFGVSSLSIGGSSRRKRKDEGALDLESYHAARLASGLTTAEDYAQAARELAELLERGYATAEKRCADALWEDCLLAVSRPAHLARTVPSASTRASIQLAEAHPITRIPLVRSSGARNLFDPSPPVTFDSTINALTRSATDAPDSRTRRAAASARRFRFVVSASVTARIARDIARVSDARDRARFPRSRSLFANHRRSADRRGQVGVA